MPREIADSDAESDLDSPIKSTKVAPTDGVLADSPSCSLSKLVNFDEFLDPTQQLSSSDINHNANLQSASGSTDRILQGIAEAQRALNFSTSAEATTLADSSPRSRAAKRTHSALESSRSLLDQIASENPSKAKRAKTSSSTFNPTQLDHDLCAALRSTGRDVLPSPSNLQPTEASPQTRLNVQHSTTLQATESRPLVNNNMIPYAATAHGYPFSTANASMGGYQSLNLDFRGSAAGIDINTNPFGSLSQVSLDETADPHEYGKFAGMFGIRREAPDPDSTRQDPEKFHQKSSEKKSRSAATAVGDLDTGRLLAPPPLLMPESGAPKKRGRKAKTLRQISDSPASATGDGEIVEDAPQHAFESDRRSRAGTIESLSQASVVSAGTSASKRKRKRSKLAGQESEPEQDLHAKQPSSQLHLSDEALIGLPKENYNPRPSRSRSKKLADKGSADSQTSGPDIKHMARPATTVSDKVGVDPSPSFVATALEDGIASLVDNEHASAGSMAPKVPRKADMKDESKDQIVEDSIHEVALIEADKPAPASGGIELPVPGSSKRTSKKGRKSKVKRAKTSAAALLKAESMLSDGDEDVIWMDSKPAPVKLELPPAIDRLKQEASIEEQATDTVDDPEKAGPQVTINIPPLEKGEPAGKPAPKKRGRKPSKRQVVSSTEDSKAVDPVAPEPARQPLADKSSNIFPCQSDPKAPTISPLSSPGRETLAAPMQDKENQHIDLEPSQSSPVKPALTPIKASSTDSLPSKLATPHSPISTSKQSIYRIGLSRAQRIPSLLRKVNRQKAAPKVAQKKETAREKKLREEREANGEDGEGDEGFQNPYSLRGADGYLMEWGD